jgi:hypothetical protein
MTEQVPSDTQSIDKIKPFQRALKDCQEVFAVLVRCDGEEDVTSIWETRRAAELCRDDHNNMKGNRAGYYGKARVLPMRLKTEKMALDLFTTPGAGQ